MGDHDEKLKNFDKSKKKVDFYDLNYLKQKIFFEKQISKLK